MPSIRAITRGHWVFLCSAFLLFQSPVIFAQDSAAEEATEEETQQNRSLDEEPLELGEVTVTAQKRETSLRDVPFSVGVMTQDALHQAGASNMADVAKNIAGFAVQDLGPGQSQVVIRGVSAGQIVRDQPGVKPSVGVYLDESVISLSLFTPDLELVDLKRVEVLRGPQGTLFGAGSLSGTVRYITNEPVLGYTYVETAVEGSAVLGDEFGEGSVDYGGAVSGIVNVPIGNNAAFRGVAYYRHMAGYIDAYQPSGNIKENVNDGYRQGGRLTFRFEPTDALTITPRVVYQYTEVNGFNRIDIYNILANPYTTTRPQVTLGGRSQYTQLQEQFTDDFLLGDVVIEIELTNDVLLTSVTSYTDREVLQIRDATQLTGSITGGSLGLPENVYTLDAPLYDETLVEVFTKELRLSNALDPNAGFRWVTGLFYSKMDRKYSQDLIVDGFTAISGVPSDDILAPEDTLYYSRIPYELTQYAVFGEGTWAFTKALDFTLGLRYYSYEEERLLFFDGIFAATVLGEPGQTEADGFSPRVMMDYEVNDSVTLNAQVSKGFRLGGINDPLNKPLCTPQDEITFGGRDRFEDETLWNYEVGAKTSFMSGRGAFNVALFYMDIENLQATVTAGTCSSRLVFNVPESHSTGMEMELKLMPTRHFEFGFSASYIQAEIDSTITSTDASGNVTVVGGIKEGNKLPTAPELQASINSTYSWQVSEDMEGFATGVYQYVGERYTQIGDQAPGFGTVDLTLYPLGNPNQSVFTFNPQLPSYQTLNLRFGIRSANWDLAMYVNNVTDERAFLAIDQERGTLARVGYITNQPRTMGIVLRNYF